MAAERAVDPKVLWQRIKRLLVQQLQTPTPSVWQALDALVPLGFDGDRFVLGCPPEQSPLMAHVTTPSTKNLLDKILQQLVNRPVRSEIIEGRTWQDYERYKEMVAVREQLERQAAVTSAAGIAADHTWRGLWQDLSKRFHQLPHRQYDQEKARFLLDAVQSIVDFMEEQLAEEAAETDTMHREIERIIERLSGLMNIPSILVAVEIERERRTRKQRTEVAASE